MSSTQKALYWIFTIPYHHFTPYLPDTVCYIKGQLERGSPTDANPDGFLHWQFIVIFKSQQRRSWCNKLFGPFHCEPTKSKAAENYVWKEDTRIDGTQFELGIRPFQRNNVKDWAAIYRDAKRGKFDDIPPDVLIRNYGNLKRISVENAEPIGVEKVCHVLWGPTGTGKSRTAWAEASFDAYPKDPLSKFWDGYRGQKHVVIDEFRGTISISHLLRWLDRYPLLVEVKGSSVVCVADTIWITSNLHPKDWYPELDNQTYEALMRRLNVRLLANK